MSVEKKDPLFEIAFTEDFYAVKRTKFDGIHYLWFIHRRGNPNRTDNRYDHEEALRLYIYLSDTGFIETNVRICVIHIRGSIAETLRCTVVKHHDDHQDIHKFSTLKQYNLKDVTPLQIQFAIDDNLRICLVRARNSDLIEKQKKEFESFILKYQQSKELSLFVISAPVKH